MQTQPYASLHSEMFTFAAQLIEGDFIRILSVKPVA